MPMLVKKQHKQVGVPAHGCLAGSQKAVGQLAAWGPAAAGSTPATPVRFMAQP